MQPMIRPMAYSEDPATDSTLAKKHQAEVKYRYALAFNTLRTHRKYRKASPYGGVRSGR
jgi:hypothetical protein